MNCSSCGHEVESGLCGSCMVRIIEKRARKAIQNKGVFPEAKIRVVNDGSCEGEVNLHLARKLFGLKNIGVSAKPETGAESSFICVPDTADKTAADFLHSMLNSDVLAGNKADAVVKIRLLGDSLSEEVLAYAKAKGISFRAKKEVSSIKSMIDGLEAKYKGTKFALAKSAEILDKTDGD